MGVKTDREDEYIDKRQDRRQDSLAQSREALTENRAI